MKYPAISRVFHYVLSDGQVSERMLARILNIHHKTLQRYRNGESRPRPYIQNRLVRYMHVRTFGELVTKAYRHYGKPYPK